MPSEKGSCLNSKGGRTTWGWGEKGKVEKENCEKSSLEFHGEEKTGRIISPMGGLDKKGLWKSGKTIFLQEKL